MCLVRLYELLQLWVCVPIICNTARRDTEAVTQGTGLHHSYKQSQTLQFTPKQNHLSMTLPYPLVAMRGQGGFWFLVGLGWRFVC